jgi:hypothetical protein
MIVPNADVKADTDMTSARLENVSINKASLRVSEQIKIGAESLNIDKTSKKFDDVDLNAISGDYEYIVTENKATITKYNGLGTDISIPSEIDGYSVTSIGESAFYGSFSLTSVAIPSSVTSIGDSAFMRCDRLTQVTIPSSVTTIGNGAFMLSVKLTNITIPEGVISIGNSTFRGCSGLTSITISENVTTIGNDAFLGCRSLKNINIPDNITSIGDNAFSGCRSLTSVTIPEGVVNIGNFAFKNSNLIEAKFLGDAPTMGFDVFDNSAPEFKIYYLFDKSGYTNPWYDYPTQPFVFVS